MTAKLISLRALIAGAGVGALLFLAPFIVRPDSVVRIYVNGSQVQFDQPPIERSGRVFVPLRGVFERLGASVVYDNGKITATGNGRDIALQIGSTTAVVNGDTRTLDVAPFIVGQRTLVPLRFISESLGANVAYDDSSRSVNISMGGGNYNPPASVSLTNLKPPQDGVVQSSRPAVSGGFSTSVDPNSVRILLDGRDVSGNAYVSKNDFLFTPTYDLTAQRHTVEIIGKSTSGVSFDRSWSFASGVSSTTNFINNLQPANGSTVSGDFTVRGTTLPNSRVRVAATSSANIVGGIFRAVIGTYTGDTVADSYGHFSQAVSVQATSGGDIVVKITSVDPNSNAGAAATLNLHT
jgi:hypothetical protein